MDSHFAVSTSFLWINFQNILCSNLSPIRCVQVLNFIFLFLQKTNKNYIFHLSKGEDSLSAALTCPIFPGQVFLQIHFEINAFTLLST